LKSFEIEHQQLTEYLQSGGESRGLSVCTFDLSVGLREHIATMVEEIAKDASEAIVLTLEENCSKKTI